jgi:leucine dehydrogenase
MEITNLPEFDDHELVSFISDKKTGLRGFIAIHRGGTQTRPALGATRLWNYATPIDAMRDALRLSHLMSHKSAASGFKYGGAKGVLMIPKNGIKNRNLFFKAYAQKVNIFQGGFVTGTDVGVTDDDVKIMKRITPYVIGGNVDPAYYTAIGVLEGIKTSLEHLFGSETIRGRSFAIQGVGKVGLNILKLIHKDAGEIFITDINGKNLAGTKEQFPKTHIVLPNEIHKKRIDVLVPCALSGILNGRSIAQLKCKIVAGSANNQLADKKTGIMLHKRGILYAPDYIINSGGLIAVVDEFENGKPKKERILKKIGASKKTLGMIFDKTRLSGTASNEMADHITERLVR